MVQASARALGPMSRAEWSVLVVFLLTALAWIFRVPLDLGVIRIPGLTDILPEITDTSIAIGAAVLLFLLPQGDGTRLFAWQDIQRGIPWGILLLFGGGFAVFEHNKRLDNLTAYDIRCSDNCCFLHCRVLNECTFHLKRPDPVAGTLDDIIVPADEPEVAILIAVCLISGVVESILE